MAGNSVCLNEKLENLGKYCAGCVFERQDQHQAAVLRKTLVRELLVFYAQDGPRLIELVSPANKDRLAHRRAFAIKCAHSLQQGAAVVVVDVVTERRANLHEEMLDVLELGGDARWQAAPGLYAVAYRALKDEDEVQLQIWPQGLMLGQSLPTLPLWIALDLSVPLELERSYAATCTDLRIRLAS